MYAVIIDDKVWKSIGRLPKDIGTRIFDKLEETKEIPHQFYKRLQDRKDYSLRIGDYRVIAEIDDSDRIILILHIGHRSKAYD